MSTGARQQAARSARLEPATEAGTEWSSAQPNRANESITLALATLADDASRITLGASDVRPNAPAPSVDALGWAIGGASDLGAQVDGDGDPPIGVRKITKKPVLLTTSILANPVALPAGTRLEIVAVNPVTLGLGTTSILGALPAANRRTVTVTVCYGPYYGLAGSIPLKDWQQSVVEPKGPAIEVIGGEEVWVTRDEDRQIAARIVMKLQLVYGVVLNSTKLVKAIKAEYSYALKSVRNKLRTRPWKLFELKALERALGRFAPILGERRAHSTRAGKLQEVTAVGKGNTSIKEDGTQPDSSVGEFFDKGDIVGIFKASESWTRTINGSLSTETELTEVHELAHGLLAYLLPQFVRDIDYWTGVATPSGLAPEAPPTDYGTKSAKEDMCESVSLYFVAPERLKRGNGTAAAGTPGNPCPERYALIDATVARWKPRRKRGK